MMRRISTVIALTFASLVATATAAMAQTSSSYPITPSPSTVVKGASGTSGGGTAFTGSSQIPLGTLMIVVLVLAGVAALFVARRRAARFAG